MPQVAGPTFGLNSAIGALSGISPFISAGASLLGGLSGFFGSSGMSQYEAAQVQNKMAYDAWRDSLVMGPTYEMKGLRLAGINPMYRYGKGGTSMTPRNWSPNIIQPFNTDWQMLAGGISDVSSAFGAYRDAMQGEQARATVPKIAAETGQTIAETERAMVDTMRLNQEIKRIQEATNLTSAQRATEIERANTQAAQTLLMTAQAILPAAQAQVFAQQAALLGQQFLTETWRTVTEANQSRIAEATARTHVTGEVGRTARAILDNNLWNSLFGEFLHYMQRAREAMLPGGGGVPLPSQQMPRNTQNMTNSGHVMAPR